MTSDEPALRVANRVAPIELGAVLARAGEGTIYEVVNHPEWVAKVFHPGLTDLSAKLEKVAAVTEWRAALLRIRTIACGRASTRSRSTRQAAPGAPSTMSGATASTPER